MAGVWAVIVTYNRPALLRRIVDAVLAQSRPVARLLVVDNASEVAAAEVLATAPPQVQVLRLPANVGGAGGFYVGLRRAMREGCEVAWLMDDDGAPDPGCLAALDRVARERPGAILNPLVIDEAAPDRLAFGLRSGRRLLTGADEALAAAGAGGVIAGGVSAFNGTYLPADAYARIGDVKYECFIWGDELDYVERARRAGVPLFTVAGALHRHPLGRGREVRVAGLVSVSLCPPARAHIHYRNLGLLGRRYHSLPYLAGKFLAYTGYLALRVSPAEAGRFLRYFLDGATDAYRLDPSRRTLAAIVDAVG